MRAAILFLAFNGLLCAQAGGLTGMVVNTYSGAPVERVQVTLTRQAAGVDASAGGMQISGAMVAGGPAPQMAAPPAPDAAALTGADGRYRFENLAAGVYILQARRAGYFTGSGVMVTVAGAGVTEAPNLNLAPPSILSGVVVDEDGEPVEGVQVQMLSRRPENGEMVYAGVGATATDDRGRFRIATAQTGAVVLSARAFVPLVSTRAPGQVYVTTYYPGTLDAAEAREVVLKPGEPLEDLKLQLRSSRVYSLRGRVLDVEGRPVVNAGLHLRPKSGDAGGLGANVQQRGAEGFEIHTVPPGVYTLIAHQFDRNQQRTATLEVTVKDNDLNGLELRMRPGVRLTGVVEIPLPPMPQGGPTDIVPIEGMDHRQSLRLFLTPLARNGAGRSYSIVTGDDGSFTVEDVQPGRYELSGFQYGTYLASVRVGDEERVGQFIEVRDGMPEMFIEYRADGGMMSLRVEGDVPAEGARQPILVLLPVDPERRRAPFLMMFTIGGRTAELRSLRPGEYYVWMFDEIARYDVFTNAAEVERLAPAAQRVTIEPDGYHEVTLRVTPGPASR